MNNSMYTLLVLFVLLLGHNNAIALPGAGQQRITGTSGLPAAQRAFLENKGQIKDQYGNARPDIDFQLRDKGMTLFVGQGKIRYQLHRLLPGATAIDNNSQSHTYQLETYRVELTLLGANPLATLETSGPLPYTTRFYGTGIPEQGYQAKGYQKLLYKNIYPDIDWAIYIKEEGIEYDFIVRPGGKVADIQMEYQGAERVQQDEQGGLTIYTPLGIIQESQPITYQEDGQLINSRFVLEDNKVIFTTSDYKGTITIDPQVKWGTYLGGDYLFDDVLSMLTDSKGNLYCGGQTSSSNIATTGTFQNTINGIVDGYVCKFNTKGERIWGTYFGGPGIDRGLALTIDHLDNTYLSVLNTDAAPGLATTGAHQTAPGGGEDAVLVKFGENGERIWSTYYGGSNNDPMGTVAVVHNALYLFGSTESANNIATPGAEKTSIYGKNNFFLAKFTLEGQRIWSTYIQGTDTIGAGGAYVICSDTKGNIYLGGQRNGGQGWATPGAHQTTHTNHNDAILFKYDSSGRKLWSTYYGGEKDDMSHSIQCDEEDNIYLAGSTKSQTNIATANSMQSSISDTNNSDFFIVKFDENGKRIWATYLGGTDEDWFPQIDMLNNKQIMLSGSTSSSDIRITDDAIQQQLGGGQRDWYLAQLDLSGNLQWSSYYGGSGNDAVQFIHISGSDVYVSGNTTSASGVATPGSHQETYGNPLVYSGLIVKFCFANVPDAGFIQGPDSVCANQVNTYSITDIGDIESCIWTLPDGWEGSGSGLSIEVTNNHEGGILSVQVIRCGDTSAPSLLPIYVLPVTEAAITIDGFTLGTVNQHSSYQWILNDQPIPGATQETYTVTENGNYRVITTDANGCVDTSAVYVVSNVSIDARYAHNQQVNIYPNPAREVLYIQAAVPVSVTLSGIDGKALVTDNTSGIIDISGYASGIYLIQVKDTEGNMLYNSKFVKM